MALTNCAKRELDARLSDFVTGFRWFQQSSRTPTLSLQRARKHEWTQAEGRWSDYGWTDRSDSSLLACRAESGDRSRV